MKKVYKCSLSYKCTDRKCSHFHPHIEQHDCDLENCSTMRREAVICEEYIEFEKLDDELWEI